MQTERPDLIQKWIATGLLRDVHPTMLQYVAERLETAFRRSPAGSSSGELDKELLILNREGLFRGVRR